MTTILVCMNQTNSPDPLDWERVAVTLPEGWGRVLSGSPRIGDRFLDRRELLFRRRAPKGTDFRGRSPLWDAFPGLSRTSPYRNIAAWTCIIRPGVPSKEPCERCRTEARRKGQRYCPLCRYIVRTANRT